MACSGAEWEEMADVPALGQASFSPDLPSGPSPIRDSQRPRNVCKAQGRGPPSASVMGLLRGKAAAPGPRGAGRSPHSPRPHAAESPVLGLWKPDVWVPTRQGHTPPRHLPDDSSSLLPASGDAGRPWGHGLTPPLAPPRPPGSPSSRGVRRPSALDGNAVPLLGTTLRSSPFGARWDLSLPEVWGRRGAW